MDRERLNRIAILYALPLFAGFICAAIAHWAVTNLIWLNELEAAASRNIVSQRPPQPPNPDILIIAFDTESAAAIGKSVVNPLERTVWAKLITLLDKAQSKAALLDIIFDGPKPEQDKVFAEAVRNLKNLKVTQPVPYETDFTEDASEPDGYAYEFLRPVVKWGELPNYAYGNVLPFNPGGVCTGVIPYRIDHTDGKPILHVALLTFLQYAGIPPDRVRLDREWHSITADYAYWKLGPNYQFEPHLTDRPEVFESISLHKALEELRSGDYSRYKDRLVLIGDLRPGYDETNFNKFGIMSGTYIIAQVVNSLMAAGGALSVGVPPAVDWLWATFLGALAAGAVLSLRAIPTLLLPILAMALAYAMPMFLIRNFDVHQETVSPFIAALLGVVSGAVLMPLRSHFRELRPAGHHEEATALFVDLRGSTSLTATLGPEKYAQFSSKLLRELSHAVEKCGGIVERTTGDGLFAVFRAKAHSEHSVAAAGCAWELAAAGERLNREYSGQGIPVKLSIAMESGILGGAHVREAGRRSWSSAGTPVNVAQRLLAVASANNVEIVVGPVANELIAHRFETRSLGAKRLRGLQGTFDVFAMQSSDHVASAREES